MDIEKAIEYNKKREYTEEEIEKMQKTVGVEESGQWDERTVEAIAEWQEAKNLRKDGMVGPNTFRKITDKWVPEFRKLTDKQKDLIISHTIKFEGGKSNPYAACNRDGEFRGLFDKPKKDRNGNYIPPEERSKHPGFLPNRHSKFYPGSNGGIHIGLSYGAWQATQRGGTLGSVIEKMKEADGDLFNEVFGGPALASQLLQTLTGPADPTILGRNPRVQKVDGSDLWEEPWISRFKKAAEYEVFRKAQRDVIVRRLVKLLPLAASYRLNSQADLAVLFDIAVQYGFGGMRRRVKNALGRPRSDKGYKIEDVINELTESKRERRNKILKEARRWIRYDL